MSVFTYDYNGQRIPFDPEHLGHTIAGCLLCGDRPIALVCVFVPHTEAMRTAVMRLRTHPIRAGQAMVGVTYGLCAYHAESDDTTTARVEARIEAMAKQVRIQ